MEISERKFNTIVADMQTASDNCIEYLKLKTESGDRNADYHRAYLHGMIRIMNILGYYVKTDENKKLHVMKEE